MDQSFAAAMRRALEQTRGGDPAGATRTIRVALAPRGGRAPSPSAEAPLLRRSMGPVEDAEIIEGRPGPATAASEVRTRVRLGEVVRALRRGSPGAKSALEPFGQAPAGPPPIPAGARYETRSHASAHGARQYRLYVPAHLPDGPQGLILMLHGCTQNPDDFARGTGMNAQADRHGLIVAYPHQSQAHNPQGCWNWFRPGDQSAASGEPAILAGLARQVAGEFGVPEGRVFAAGLSAGGAMAAILGVTHPRLFTAVGVHSGLPAGAAHDVVSAFAAMRGETAARAGATVGGRMVIFHGTADATVHPANGEALARAAAGASPGATVAERDHGVAGGRSYRRLRLRTADGRLAVEQWQIDGLGHAWSGGHASGSHADPAGPSASEEIVRFFLE